MFATYSCEFMRAAANSSPVSIKYMNIIDPLLPNNNLGRSVSRIIDACVSHFGSGRNVWMR